LNISTDLSPLGSRLGLEEMKKSGQILMIGYEPSKKSKKPFNANIFACIHFKNETKSEILFLPFCTFSESFKKSVQGSG
jgi:hypothetical protein